MSSYFQDRYVCSWNSCDHDCNSTKGCHSESCGSFCLYLVKQVKNYIKGIDIVSTKWYYCISS